MHLAVAAGHLGWRVVRQADQRGTAAEAADEAVPLLQLVPALQHQAGGAPLQAPQLGPRRLDGGGRGEGRQGKAGG